ncbi:hypothetical protein F442_23093 [Phytophthora nicotianae P10297]|uniref:Uncharacterized protein n=5 Tax=Phytophthora nicotianae TaxID=4792 RepID=W2Q0V9_PHYN3|nr:hypothetical protein PPTG_23273 [Phytophthora nicotianae INRA-310]XP_008907781.1 hypothetical protein PPTG_23275 [Phytophthora nicotianae INRA-310]ETI29760.1 hypothetical protein F443_23125 [Phytophthora nicotianae P1569]ETL90059.1 hypothetical protein L917_11117 [Phytophthora nicotianae]ETO72058.1 hypothetical protein F444_11710 [Phytophthora nicotianae P1976]ETP27631.1 hypothetical protein F442_23093 [Phytophthora nicotianae P10297]ETN06807.1 hypothetical protein PPTG_23273 [Phytophthora
MNAARTKSKANRDGKRRKLLSSTGIIFNGVGERSGTGSCVRGDGVGEIVMLCPKYTSKKQ